MSEIIRVQDEYYILASAVFADEGKWVLKDGDTFSIWDRTGDIRPLGLGEQGIYHEGTRFLSRFEFRMAGRRPLLLSSDVAENNILLIADLTNPDFHGEGQKLIPRGTLHVFRVKFFWKGICYERIKVWNLGMGPVRTEISVALDSDYADIFEVRGTRRARRGKRKGNEVSEGGFTLLYEGLDGVERRTRLDCQPAPKSTEGAEIRFDLSLEPKGQATYLFTITCESDGVPGKPILFDHALEQAEELRRRLTGQYCGIMTFNPQFNGWIKRSMSDLQMMVTPTPQGSYPYAGVPWFSTPFGRDGILTALESLWVNPDIARGVLKYLAATQAVESIPDRDAEPGKIMHETRKGEMASLNEIPFGLYYGSVDSTPLFVFLAGCYYERTGDRALIEEIWKNLEAAIQWMDRYGDLDGDGFVEYRRRSPHGLTQQGWKDSEDSVSHSDGVLAEGPIALCEVQAYAYAAKKKAAALAAALGKEKESEEWSRQAEALRLQFEKAFWCEELSTYALALDGEKRPCKVRSSNAGHCLLGRIASPERAARLAERLMDHESFSGWGIRTLASSEARYNPMSYHNGSVWPHDNALISYGMGLYGLKDFCLQVIDSLFETSSHFPLGRMPELFCGFAKRPGEGPTRYPVACSPQSWASASPFLLLQACLGLTIDGVRGKILFDRPVLPPSIQELWIQNLQIGKDSMDLHLNRHFHDVNVSVARQQGNIEVSVLNP